MTRHRSKCVMAAIFRFALRVTRRAARRNTGTTNYISQLSAMPTQTQLCPPLNSIPTVEPHLMPFHIDHSGYAPVSTYFRVKPDLTTPASEETKDSDTTPNASESKFQRLKKRVVSAFRGRKLKGVVVDIPEGYTGVILQADDEVGFSSSSSASSGSLGLLTKKQRPVRLDSPKKGKRLTRRNAALEAENENDVSPEFDAEQSVTETKILRPVGTFNSVTIWSPDVDVDETQDEYIRTLDSYRRLLEVIHQTEPTTAFS